MKLKDKLILAFLGIASLGGILGVLNIRTTQNVNEKFNKITEQTVPELIELERTKMSSLRLIAEAYSSALISGESRSKDLEISVIKGAKEAEEEEEEEWQEAAAELKASLERLIEITNDTERKEIYQKMLGIQARMENIAREIVELKQREIQGKEILVKQQEFEGLEEEFLEAIDSLINAELEMLRSDTLEAETSAINSFKYNLVSTLSLLVISVFIGKILSDRITAPILKLKKAASEIGNGRLETRVDIDSSDEISFLANSFNSMAEKLKETTVSKTYVDEIIRSLNEGLIIIDENNKIKDINPAVTILTGYKKEEIVGQTIKILMKEIDSINYLQEKCQYCERKYNCDRIESYLLTKEKQSIPVHLTASSLKNEGREVREFVCLIQDISARKKYEQQLISAKEAALEAVKIKTQFVANVSHEIRTPMNGILGMIELLLITDLTPEQLDYVQTLKDSGHHLLALVEDILNFSKLESGKIPVENQEFNLYECLSKTLKLLLPQAKEKNINLELLIQKGVPQQVWGDARKLQQIIINLVINGIKFTKKGEVVVLVSIVEAAENSSKVTLKFSIKDTGIGIAPENIDRIFQSFVQGDGSRTRRYQGTGLGLAVCQELINLMHGEIGVESQLGKGTTFWFTLNLQKVGQPIALAKASRE